MSVEQIVSEFSEQPAEVITDGDDENEDEESNEQITHPWRNDADETNKTLNRLAKSVTEDLRFDHLISKPTRIIKHWRNKSGNRQ